MNRRHFLQRNATVLSAPVAAGRAAPAATAQQDPPETVSRYANKVLPTFASRLTSTLTPYTGTWGEAQAAHLLRRCLFGPTRTEIQTAAAANLTTVLNGLLTVPATAPDPPLNVSTTDTSVPIGTTWMAQTFDQNFEGVRRTSLRDWWLGQLLTQNTSLVEKMTLFWHNHFVVEFGDINDARMGYEYCRLLRQYALGNVKQLAKDVTVTPAMLRYLNGNQSTAGAPNENYGRELLELFTVGKGPLIAAGNYTNYTEADVQAAAKVLTGWRDQNAPVGSYFTASRHDTTTKTFSSAFGNATIANAGATEYQNLIDLIFQQAETARFIVRKLYRWFVYYVIDAQVETDIIRPLATLLISSNFEVAPVLRTLLSSEHFFDVLNMGCLIKSPLDFTVGLCRQMQVMFPPASGPVAQYGMWNYLNAVTSLQQQVIGDPPNVAGWAAYYQTPQFHELWINAVTLPRRNQITDLLIGSGYTRNGVKIVIDVLALTQSFPAATASDCNLLIAEYVKLMVPITLTANQLAFLKTALLPGLPDFEWTVEWQQYLAAPTNTAKKAAVTTKLQAMLRALMGLAEYHLS
ncbi:DUF1800 domain-containing protein [Hymenobacter properus]|uniref:DUF1800 domain-containing protein n=1 Tax=Hymenobacter properus TaxID=2791026 RepID=A0A931FJG4_9BACT|nr:DUF1800 domain-containing protein [Hymenobacter properus]MBF9142962.1 DUF1800 domain-containing protein [Hymenobacter properus]MBR7721769.1 DUF1800 domain-containing protein [Microvirga sp. SRT04]